MTRDLRRLHRVAWWILPVLLTVLLTAAVVVRVHAARALAPSTRGQVEGAR